MNVPLAVAHLFIAAGLCTAPAFADVDLRGVDPPPMPPVTQAQIAPYLANGSAVISGRIFAKLIGIKLKPYGRVRVELVPAIPFEDWAVDNDLRRWYGDPSVGRTPPPTGALREAVRNTIADASGSYRFDNLPALPYVVKTIVEALETREYTTYETESTLFPVFDPDGSQHFEPQENVTPQATTYVCHSIGFLIGRVTAAANTTSPASLAVMLARNQGC